MISDKEPPKDARVRVDAVKEAYLECLGFWPTNEAKGGKTTLNEREFYVYCNDAEKDENQMDDAPSDYIPLDYRENPNEWNHRKSIEEANRKQFDETFGSDFMHNFVGAKEEDFVPKMSQSIEKKSG